MYVRNAHLANTFRDQDDTDGAPLIIGVKMVGYEHIACFHLRYMDGETRYVPITQTSLGKVMILTNGR